MKLSKKAERRGIEMTSTQIASGEEKTVKVPKKGGKRKKKIKKIIIWTVVVLGVLLIAASKFGLFSGNRAGGAAETYTTFTVARRDIQNVLTGTGTLQPYDSYTVTALSSGEILEDYFEEGDEVEEDQILMKIDSSNLDSSLDRAQNSYDNAKEALDDLYESREDLNVASDYSGVIQVMDIDVGDDIMSGSVIASVIDRDTMLIDIPFMQVDTFNIKKGDTAVLTVGDTLEKINGTVNKISPSYTVNQNGVKTVKVTIAVSNPGAISESTSATAKIGEYSCTQASTFYYNVNETIKAEISGTVLEIIKGEGDYVSAGETVIVLESESLEDNIEKAEQSLKDAFNSLEDAIDAFDNYEITAPISGTVVQKNYKKGEKIGGSGGSGNTIAVIYDLSALKFDMNIDELDIDDLELGQEVIITSEAKKSTTYTGKITKISVQGTTSNGTTYYPITVTLEEYGKDTEKELRPGMNIDAEIILEKVEDALVVPVSAVGRGNKVKVVRNAVTDDKNNIGDANQSKKPSDAMQIPEGMEMPEGMKMPEGKEMPEGMSKGERPNMNISGGYSTVSKDTEYEEITVETGISDDEYIEILSGLEEGDIVIIQSTGTTTSQWGNMTGMGMGGMNMGGMGMGGGMPSGMPSGGMPGGGMGGMGGR